METAWYFLQVNICLGIFALLYNLLLARESFLQTNRVFLLAAIGLSFVLPLLRPEGLGLLVSTPGEYVLQSVVLPDSKADSVGWTLLDLLKALYWTGLVVFGLRFAHDLFRIASLRFRFGAHQQAEFTLVRTHGEMPTFSFFSMLFWDDNVPLQGSERLSILDHELTHIRQRHSLDMLIMNVVRILFWFNPAAWLLSRRLNDLHEFIADKEASRRAGSREYQRLLASVCLRQASLSIAHSFGQRPIDARLQMLRRLPSRPEVVWRYLLAIPTMALLLLGCSFFALPQPSDARGQIGSTALPIAAAPVAPAQFPAPEPETADPSQKSCKAAAECAAVSPSGTPRKNVIGDEAPAMEGKALDKGNKGRDIALELVAEHHIDSVLQAGEIAALDSLWDLIQQAAANDSSAGEDFVMNEERRSSAETLF